MKISEYEEPGLFLLGVELLDLAGKEIFNSLEKHLEPLFGPKWFVDSLVRSNEDKELAPRDLSVLLIQIVIRNNANFRLAISAEYFENQPLRKDYFEHLTDLRVARNEWFHRIIDPITTDEIKDLAETIIEVFPAKSDIFVRCTELLSVLTADEFTGADLFRTSKAMNVAALRIAPMQSSETIDQKPSVFAVGIKQDTESNLRNNDFTAENLGEKTPVPHVASIGESYAGSLLPYKYTLKLDGTILDKRQDRLLSEVTGSQASDLGRELLSFHPTGGRLRISSDGVIVGYQSEEWVVIGRVDLSDWFPL